MDEIDEEELSKEIQSAQDQHLLDLLRRSTYEELDTVIQQRLRLIRKMKWQLWQMIIEQECKEHHWETADYIRQYNKIQMEVLWPDGKPRMKSTKKFKTKGAKHTK